MYTLTKIPWNKILQSLILLYTLTIIFISKLSQEGSPAKFSLRFCRTCKFLVIAKSFLVHTDIMKYWVHVPETKTYELYKVIGKLEKASSWSQVFSLVCSIALWMAVTVCLPLRSRLEYPNNYLVAYYEILCRHFKRITSLKKHFFNVMLEVVFYEGSVSTWGFTHSISSQFK